MIYLPVSLFLFLLFLLLFPLIWLSVALDLVEIAVAKLGFSPQVAFFLFAAVLLGSLINIPLYQVESTVTIVPDLRDMWLRQFWGIPLQKITQKTIVALNVGGGLIPVLLAIYELTRSDLFAIFLVTAIVTVVSYYSAHVVPGIGIQMNALISPLTACLSALLKEIERMSPGVVSIGGAGVFDGIAMCGLFALLLS